MRQEGRLGEAYKQAKTAVDFAWAAGERGKGQAQAMLKSLQEPVVEKLTEAGEQAKAKEYVPAMQTYCTIMFQWAGSDYGVYAGKQTRKLRRKVDVKRAIKETAKDVKQAMREAKEFERRRQYEEAMMAYQDVIDRYPMNKDARKAYARLTYIRARLPARN